MKKALFTLSIAVAALSAITSIESCKDPKDAIKIDPINYTASTDITVPVTNDTSAQILLGQSTFDVDIDKMIKDETKGLASFSSIKSIKISSVTVTITNPDANNNFANFNNATAILNTDGSGGTVTPYTVADIKSNPNTYSDKMVLDITDKDKEIKPYFSNQTKFQYKLMGKLRKNTTKEVHCHMEMKYDIQF